MPVGKWFREEKLEVESDFSVPFVKNLYIQKSQLEHTNKIADHRLFLYNHLVLGKYLESVDNM